MPLSRAGGQSDAAFSVEINPGAGARVLRDPIGGARCRQVLDGQSERLEDGDLLGVPASKSWSNPGHQIADLSPDVARAYRVFRGREQVVTGLSEHRLPAVCEQASVRHGR